MTTYRGRRNHHARGGGSATTIFCRSRPVTPVSEPTRRPGYNEIPPQWGTTTGKAAREAAAKARDGRFDQAAHSLRAAATAVQSLSASEFTEDAQSLLDQSLRRIGSGDLTARDLKELVYESRHRTRSSSHDLYTGSRKKQKSGASGKGQRRQTEQ